MIDELGKMTKHEQEIFMSNLHHAIERKYMYRLNVFNTKLQINYKYDETDYFTEATKNFGECVTMLLNKHNICDEVVKRFFNVDKMFSLPISLKKEYENRMDVIENIFLNYLLNLGYDYKLDVFIIQC